jgi:hypothetical protein
MYYPPSVSRAGFVTTGSIDLKLLYVCTGYPRSDNLTDQILVQSGSLGAKTKNT